jgi:glycolate oxidase
MSRCCEEAGATLVVAAEDEAESDLLMEARRLCFPALERRGGTLLEDVGVPRGRLADLLARIEAIAAETGLTIATFGHAGDGNMHPTIVFDRESPGERARALEAAGALFEAALALGGTITGEHGVGTLKLPWLEREIGGPARELARGIKRVFDPQGILNPGKAL